MVVDAACNDALITNKGRDYQRKNNKTSGNTHQNIYYMYISYTKTITKSSAIFSVRSI